ncbi:MAG: RHS repeat domain-containing protein, partial [Pseudomonadota bacterium]
MRTYDAAGNLASLWDINNTQITYAYDATGRLTGALDTAAGSFGS